MLKALQCGNAFAVTKKHAWVCLLLPILLLCNPFLATSESSGGLAIHHPPSYRATVASPELLKFKNTESREAIVLVHCDLLEAFTLLQPELRQSARQCNTEDPLPPDQFLSGNLWFRPPPAA